MRELAGHGEVALTYEVALSEQDGSWTAVIDKLGVHMIAASAIEARSIAQAHALRTIANHIETARSAPDKISFEVWAGD